MFTVTKTTQGAYTAYVLADTGAGTTANAPEGGDAWQDVLGTD